MEELLGNLNILKCRGEDGCNEPDAFLGLDIGSTTVKAVLLDGELKHLAEPAYLRSLGHPVEALSYVINDLRSSFHGIVRVGITGSGREVLRQALGLPPESTLTEINAQAAGAWYCLPGVRTVIDIGGQDNKCIWLQRSKAGSFAVADFAMNDLCAAGTGAFLEMHSRELGFESVAAFAECAAKARRAARVAGRCSVLAQSDVVHLRQAGEPVEEIAAGLCRAVACNVLGMAAKRAIEAPVLFLGGVAANAGVVRAFRQELGLDEQGLIVPRHHCTTGALGAALHAAQQGAAWSPQALADIHQQLASFQKQVGRKSNNVLPGLNPVEKVRPVEAVAQNQKAGPAPADEVALGLDVGSASVKIVAVDRAGGTIFKHYTLHEGRPLDALRAGLASLHGAIGAAKIMGVGVTGSGRDLVELSIGVDLNIDEITAQAAGARRLAGQADAIFEIGGQDSKFIAMKDGNVSDFEMNRICAAGTGAFLAEAARLVGTEPGAGMDELAFSSQNPAAMSHRCCVFAKSDIVSMLNAGTARQDVAAGAVYAIARNYLTLVVGSRQTGRRIVFLGGVAASSAAVLAALRQMRPELDIVVPVGCETSGAFGVAHLVLERATAGTLAASQFHGFEPEAIRKPARSFECKGCSNTCRIREWNMKDGAKHFTGGICERYESAGSTGKPGHDFVADFLRLIKSFEPEDGNISGQEIGVPRALLYYEQGPLWVTFLSELGYRVVLSEGGPEAVRRGSRRLINSSVCLPVKVLAGHVADLESRGVRRVFLPTVIEMDRHAGATRSDACMLVQSAVDAFMRPAFPGLEFVSPVFHFHGRRSCWREVLIQAAVEMGHGRREAFRAVGRAAAAQESFVEGKKELGREFMDEVGGGATAVTLMGRSYSCSPELNMGLPRMFARQGVTVAPLAILPYEKHGPLDARHSDQVFRSSQDLILGAACVAERKGAIFPVLMAQFLCRQDSAAMPVLTEMLAGRPTLQLCMDENSGDAGLRTRCAAFCHVMDNTVRAGGPAARKRGEALSVFVGRSGGGRPRGKVWLLKQFRFYAAGFNAIGVETRFLDDENPDAIERGRKYFSRGEPCLPFVREAGIMELLSRNPEFDPSRDVIHMPGTRHCASAGLPQVIHDVLAKLGLEGVRIISPREGLDISEGFELFGPAFPMSVARALVAGEYLRKILMAIRPYEAVPGDADKAYAEAVERLYASFGGKEWFFTALRGAIARMASVETRNEGSRPRILVTGEYVTRTNTMLNGDLHRKIESHGGESVYVPLFTDYVELVGRRRALTMWQLGKRVKAACESVMMAYLTVEMRVIKRMFAAKFPVCAEPDIIENLQKCEAHLTREADPVMRLELGQAAWRMEQGAVAGIVSAAPFGCSVSTAISPLVHHLYGEHVPVLSLWFDGQAGVHSDNRLAAFMECVHAELQRAKPAEANRQDYFPLPAEAVPEIGPVSAANMPGNNNRQLPVTVDEQES